MDDSPLPPVDPALVIRRRYSLALSLVALLLALSQVAIQVTLSRGDDDSRLVNVSGRQRMLSQAIAKVSLELTDAKDVSARIGPVKELYEAVMEFQGTHDGLLAGSPTMGVNGRNSPAIIKLYEAIERDYRAILDAASSLRLRAVAPDLRPGEIQALSAVVLAHESRFLDGMNKVVYQYDTEAQGRRNFIRSLEYLLFGLTLLALLAEALLIFRPAERQLGDYFSRLREALEALHERATYDQLTGLYNRGTGLLLLKHEMEKSRRAGAHLVVCFLDLDGLKAVNDVIGHEAGDRYISGFAACIRSSIRSEDIAFRHGGDEFVIIVAGDPEAAKTVIDRIKRLFEETRSKIFGAAAASTAVSAEANPAGRTGFSYGFVPFDPRSNETPDILLSRADGAMYEMKRAHHGRPSARSLE